MASLRTLQLNWLRTFEAVARLMSFSAAAGQLNMSQSAVSQQIRLLEGKLGRRLFLRKRRSIELTVAGRAYFGVVREALQHVEHGMATIFNSVAQGVLEVSVNGSFAQMWLAPRVTEFTRRYPQVTLRLYGVNWEADAPPSSAELEIRYGKGVWPGLEASKVLSHTMRPYCSRSTSLIFQETGVLADITLIDVLGTPVGWTEWLARNWPDRSRSYRRIHVDSFAVAADMAAHNVGMCLLSTDLVAGSTHGDVLLSPIVQTIDDEFGFYLLRSTDISGAAQAFSSWLQKEASISAAGKRRTGTSTRRRGGRE